MGLTTNGQSEENIERSEAQTEQSESGGEGKTETEAAVTVTHHRRVIVSSLCKR